jgi:predicted regulator of Ras-like GTPase activity (Roadblock/LC7/MglB family)
MYSLAERPLQHPSLAPNLPMTYSDDVVGAAIFDLNGLPKEYFTTPEDDNVSWVQTIFQALGLRSLLMSSLQLEGFHHATILGTTHSAVVVKQKAHYVALLVQPHAVIDAAFIGWVQTFESSELKSNARFQLV